MSARPQTVRFGVIGCGVIAYWTHLRILRRLPGAKLVVAADPDPAARERARRLTGAEVVDDHRDLLGRDDVDAVVISSPTNLHADTAISAAEASKHFYLEKPAAIDRREAMQLAETTARAGVVAAVGLNRRSHPLSRQARDFVSAGKLGAVRAALSVSNEPFEAELTPAWRRKRATGGGVLLDLGSHHFDLIPWLLGTEIASVQAQLRSISSEEDEATVSALTASGVPVQSSFSFRAARADFIEIIGERGTLRLDKHRSQLDWRVLRRFGYGVRRVYAPANAEALRFQLVRDVRPSYDPSYRSALLCFAEAVRTGQPPAATLQDGLRSLEVVLAAEESARSGRPEAVAAPAA